MSFLTRRSDRIPNLTVGWMCWQGEKQVQILVERGLVLLDDHQIVAILRTDLPGGRAQGVQCIERDDLASQVPTSQQRWDGTALIALLCNFGLA